MATSDIKVIAALRLGSIHSQPHIGDHLTDLANDLLTLGRMLGVRNNRDLIDQPGHLVLDFNQLQNPPCAYTPYATCPLPPAQNRLALALPVGEKRYSH